MSMIPHEIEAGLPELLMRPVQVSLSEGLLSPEGGEAPVPVRFVIVTADTRENGQPVDTAKRNHLILGVDDATELIIQLTHAVNYHAELNREAQS